MALRRNKMSILILNRMSNASASYYEWLKELNEPIVFLCDEVRKGRVDERYEVLEFFPKWRLNGNIERLAIELHQKYKFRSLLAFSESDMERAAQLREILDIPGQSIESAEAFRNKVKMKTILKEKGISVPEFREIKHPIDLLDFCKTHEFPVVYKPIDGAGSENTSVLFNFDDVTDVMGKTAFQPYEVECFVVGDMCHVDGVWVDGKMEFVSASQYVNGCLGFQEGKYLASYIIDDEQLLSRLTHFTEQVLQSLPTPQACPFHAEIFVTPTGELVLCEIASRAGGARIIETYNQLYKYHLIENATLAQCGLPLKQAIDKQGSSGWLMIPPQNGRLIEIPTELPFLEVTEFLVHAKPGDTFHDATRSIDHILSVIVKAETSEAVVAKIDQIAQWLNERIKWEI